MVMEIPHGARTAERLKKKDRRKGVRLSCGRTENKGGKRKALH